MPYRPLPNRSRLLFPIHSVINGFQIMSMRLVKIAFKSPSSIPVCNVRNKKNGSQARAKQTRTEVSQRI